MGHIKPLKEAVRVAESTETMRQAIQAWIQPDREQAPRAGFRTPEAAI
jgi:hypothetical protein